MAVHRLEIFGNICLLNIPQKWGNRDCELKINTQLYEIGSISHNEYLYTIIFYRSRNLTKGAFKDLMFAQSDKLPAMLDWLIEWKKKNAQKFRII